MNLPGSPMVDFHKFFDGENITQEDLVAWVNVGMHHLVRAWMRFTPLSKFPAFTNVNYVLLSRRPKIRPIPALTSQLQG